MICFFLLGNLAKMSDFNKHHSQSRQNQLKIIIMSKALIKMIAVSLAVAFAYDRWLKGKLPM
jgi:hypothetical protein